MSAPGYARRAEAKHGSVIVVADHRGYPEQVFPNTPKFLKIAQKMCVAWNAQFPSRPHHLRWYRLANWKHPKIGWA